MIILHYKRISIYDYHFYSKKMVLINEKEDKNTYNLLVLPLHLTV